MQVNEGVLDRSLRAIAGVLLIGLALAGVIGPWGYIGLLALLTSAVGMCPLYSLLGVDTRPVPRS